MVHKRIICLASSRKLGGRSVVGVEIDKDGHHRWVRPVSGNEHGELYGNHRWYLNGSEPRVLDIIDLSLLQHTPNGYQQENWLIAPDHRWCFRGKASWSQLESFVEQPGLLWVNWGNTLEGQNDQMDRKTAASQTHSLTLIHVKWLRLRVFRPGLKFGDPRRRVQGKFHIGGTEYWLWVTDPLIEKKYLALGDGDYALNDCYLTLSLTETPDGYCYKLIAAVIQNAS